MASYTFASARLDCRWSKSPARDSKRNPVLIPNLFAVSTQPPPSDVDSINWNGPLSISLLLLHHVLLFASIPVTAIHNLPLRIQTNTIPITIIPSKNNSATERTKESESRWTQNRLYYFVSPSSSSSAWTTTSTVRINLCSSPHCNSGRKEQSHTYT